MKSIEDHIQKDKDLIADPKVSEPMRRHALEELHDLEVYVDHHHEEIEAGDHHDPNVLELFCEMHPDEPECLVCLLYTSPSPRDPKTSRMPSSA